MRVLLLLLGLIASVTSFGQAGSRDLFEPLVNRPDAATSRSSRESWYRLDEPRLRWALSRLDTRGETQPVVLWLPDPDGSMRPFAVSRSVVMAPELAARFPEIETFQGQAVDGSRATLRFELSPVGFTAMAFVPGRVQLIEPDAGTGDYVSFVRERREGDAPFRCSVTGEPLSDKSMPVSTELQRYAQGLIHARPKASGPTLRTYRTAVAATVEYTASFGGTVLGAMRGIATAINRINQVYETEIGVRLVLVPNNAAVVYTVEPDPYTNNSGSTMLGQNQTNLTNVIGGANYDVGHVFSTGGGGVATLGSVCNATSKARGVTGLPSPNLDPFWVDYVAHEIGHQLNAPHTFNATTASCGGSNRSAANAYEVGSGSTIMAYAGICGAENLQANSDPFFHVRSLDTIHTFVQSGVGATCGSTSPTGNQVPIVNAVANRTIPARTPFALTASATDPDGDPLTYSWEQFDLDPTGSTAGTVNQDNGLRPLFRSFDASSSPTRLFPRLADILSGTQTIGEVLPTTNRSLNFRVTVRDNRPGGGGVQWTGTTAPPVAQTTLTVVDTGAAFAVTGLDSATTWAAGSAQTVTWNVAGTTAAPISCANVRIDWSTDNGNSGFPIVLLASTPNDGTQGITVPSQSTSAGRVRVGCADNIFFDINNAAITVTGGNAAPTLTLPGATVTYVSTGAAVILDATATVADSDSANFDGGSLTLTLSNNAEANDRLEIRNQGSGAGEIGVSGSSVQFGGTSIGSFSGGVGTVPLVVQFNASATPAAAQALLRNITYRSVTQVLGTLPRTVTAQVADGDGGVSVPASELVSISFTDRTIAFNFDDSDANDQIAGGDPLTYTIRFTRDIDLASVSAADFDNAGTATFAIDSITEPSAGTLSVQLRALTTGTLILRIPASATINDVGGPGQIVVPAQDENTVSVVTPLVFVSRTVTTNGGVVQPNSCNSFDVQVRNEAAMTATGITGIASSSTAAAPIAQASSAFADAASGATVGNSTPFQFSVAPDAVCGSTINAEIQLTYGGPTGPSVLPVTFQVGALGTVLSENFDGVTAPALPSGWTTSQTGATPPPAFATDTSGANSAPNVAFTNGVATVATNSLVTPAVVFPAGSYNGRLSFQTAWNFENGGWDGGVIEVSTDNGTTWLDVTDPAIGGSFVQGGYNGTIRNNDNPLRARSGFVNTEATYQTVTVQFPPSLNGQTLRFRFRAGWDSQAVAAGPNWRIDGVVIQAGIACTADSGICAANQPSRLAFASQPSNAATNAVISPAVSVRVLDSLGNPTSSTATVNVAIANNPGAATLSGSTSAAAVAGVASFSNLSLNQPGAGYTLSASSPGLTGATSAAFNVAGVAVTPTTGLVTTEAGGTASFTVVLASPPSADVTIGLSSSDTTEGTVSPTSLTFTGANWNVAQVVTVTGVDDSIDDGNVAYTIVTAPASSGDPAYSGFNAADVSVTNTDDDNAGVTVTQSGGNTAVTEGGATDDYTLVLTSQPTANVTVAVTPNAQLSVSPISVTFTSANWNMAQTVTVTAVDDAVAEGSHSGSISHTVSSADGNYSGLTVAGVTATITDNDNPGVTVTQTGGSTAVTEGGATDDYTLVLTSQPTANVTVAVNPNAQLTTAPTSVTFTSANWNLPQTVTVTAVDDNVAEGNHSGTVSHTVTSADAAYNGFSVANVTASITDNDLPTLSINDVSVIEGNSGTATLSFTVTRTGATTSAAGFSFATANDTATAGSDYVAVSGTGSIPAGGASGSTQVSVTINGDAVFENHETLFVNLTAPINATIADNQGIGTISNDDTAPTLAINDVSIFEGNNGMSSLVFTVTRTGLTELPATFTATTADGTATAPSDYLAALTGSTSIAAGGATGTTTLSATINGDAVVEPNETFFVNLTAPGNATISDNQGIGTITNDDTAGITLVQSNGNTAVTEGGATDNYTLVLTSQPTANVTVSVNPNAQLTTSVASVSFTSANWNLPQTVTVTAVDDNVAEGNHSGTVSHTVTSADAAYNGVTVASVAVDITDNDLPTLSIDDVSVTEGNTGTATLSFTVTRTGATTSAAGFAFATANGTATAGSDYVAVSGTGSIPAGGATGSTQVSVTINGDAVFENHETLFVNLTAPSNATIADGQGIGTITNDDTAPTLAINDVSILEGNTGTSSLVFTVTRTGLTELPATFTATTADGTATAPSDYLAALTGSTSIAAGGATATTTLTATINGDAVVEPNETFFVNLTAPGNATISDNQGIGTISNDDMPGVTVTQSNGNTAVTEGGATDDYTLVLTSQPTADVVIALTSGTQLTTSLASVTFTPTNWNTPQSVMVSAVDDAIAEGTHSGSVTHVVTSGDANYQGRLVDSVSATITDNDVAGITVTQSDGNTAVTEGGSTDTISVVLSSEPLAPVTVTITPNAQLTVASSPLTFTPTNWNMAQTVTVTAANDGVVEGTHDGTLAFGVASTDPAYAAITLPGITASITDNDSAMVSFAPASVSQSEASSPMAFTVTLSNPVASGVTVKVDSADGTATTGPDYSAIIGGSVTFAPNSTTAQTVNVAVTNDTLDEDNETYTLTLSGINATGDVTLGAATATGTIEDDDALPTLSVSNVTQPEGNASNTLTFTVNLSPVSGRAVSFTRATQDGSAVSTGPNADFVAIPASTVTIPAGQTSVTIPVTINGDTVFEGDQSFTLSVTDVANATPGSLSATATLTDDDQQPTTTTIVSDLPDPSVVGQPYPVTVEVRAQTLAPLGTVSITDGSGASCTAPLTAGMPPLSTMTCTLTSTSAGARTLTASYTPANDAFAASNATESHTVNAAATSLVLLGPARARIGTAASYTAELSVTAPGAGTPAGIVTVSAGSNSCTITLPTATPSCTLTFSTLGSRAVSASFAPGNGNFLGSTATPVQTLVFASSDVSVTKTNAVNTYRPGDLLVYTVIVRNNGPDAAPQVRIRDVAPAGLTNVAWTCEASGGAICPDSGGTGTLDHVVATLPTGGTLTYAYFGNVTGRPAQIVNTAEVILPADTTIEDPNPANNSATDTDLLDDLFTDGFEAPGINAETGGVRLAGASLRSSFDDVARVRVRLSDVRGEALRVYVRVVGGELQVALALRGADGNLRLGSWQRPVGDPELTWTATPTAGGFVLSGASLR